MPRIANSKIEKSDIKVQTYITQEQYDFLYHIATMEESGHRTISSVLRKMIVKAMDEHSL